MSGDSATTRPGGKTRALGRRLGRTLDRILELDVLGKTIFVLCLTISLQMIANVFGLWLVLTRKTHPFLDLDYLRTILYFHGFVLAAYLGILVWCLRLKGRRVFSLRPLYVFAAVGTFNVLLSLNSMGTLSTPGLVVLPLIYMVILALFDFQTSLRIMLAGTAAFFVLLGLEFLRIAPYAPLFLDRKTVELTLNPWIFAFRASYVLIFAVASFVFLKFLRSKEYGLEFLERRRAEKALGESERRLELALEGAELGMWDLDIRASELTFNARFAEILGYGAEEAPRDVNFWALRTRREDLARPIDAWRLLLQGEAPLLNVEYRALSKSGEWRWLHDRGKVVKWGPNRKPLRAAGTRQDVTEKRLNEEERERLEGQLRTAEKMEAIGHLAGGVAHDFNNLLSVALGYCEMIEDAAPYGGEAVDGYAAKIRSSILRMRDLTNQLLGFARKGKRQVIPVDLHAVIREVAGLLGRAIGAGIAVRLDFQADRSVVLGDPTLMQQLVLNLSINARDAMPDGGELTFETRIATPDEEFRRDHPEARPDEYLMIAVKDTGVGVPPEVRDRIFEPFFTTKPPGKGTGMGLATVYGIVKNHDGLIAVENEEGRGAVFRIYFPPSDEEPPARWEAEEAGPSRGEGRILLVDDEEALREMLSRMLADLGYETVEAKNGREAVEYYRRRGGTVDLVLLDMVMPEMGGLECFRELKKLDPGVRVVLSSGYDVDEKAQTVMNEGALGFLHKPYTKQRLAEKLREVLEGQAVYPQSAV